MMNERTFTIHMLGFRSSERMVLQSFLSALESKHKLSLVLKSSLGAEEHAHAAIVNMDDTAHTAEVDMQLTDYSNSIPCLLMYNKDQHRHEEHIRDGMVSLFKPMNFPDIASRMYQMIAKRYLSAPTVTRSDFTVLVVDDSASVRTDMRLKLESSGVNVDVAVDAEDALNRVARHAYALVFMDVMMPGAKDGYDACREIKHQHPELPVLMLSSKDSMFSKVRGKIAKCDQYLTKPATKDEINEALATFVLGHHQLHEEPNSFVEEECLA